MSYTFCLRWFVRWRDIAGKLQDKRKLARAHAHVYRLHRKIISLSTPVILEKDLPTSL